MLAMQDYKTSGYTFVIHTDDDIHLMDLLLPWPNACIMHAACIE